MSRLSPSGKRLPALVGPVPLVISGAADAPLPSSPEGMISYFVFGASLTGDRIYMPVDGPGAIDGQLITLQIVGAAAFKVLGGDLDFPADNTVGLYRNVTFRRDGGIWDVIGASSPGDRSGAGADPVYRAEVVTDIPGSPTAAAGAGGGSDLASASGLVVVAGARWFAQVALHVNPTSDAVISLRVLLENEATLTRYECIPVWGEFVSPESGPYSRVALPFSPDSGGAPDGVYSAILQATANNSGVPVPVTAPSLLTAQRGPL